MKNHLQFHDLAFKFMRITIFQLLMCIIFINISFGNGTNPQDILSKSITLNLEDKPIKAVLTQLEKLSEAQFLYSSSLIRVNTKVTINVNNKPLSEVLNTLLRPLHLNYRLSGKQIILNRVEDKVEQLSPNEESRIPTKPVKVVTGKVTDENDKGVSGVNIREKGNSNNGVSSDKDGNYTIKVKDENSALVFSFVGYTTKEIKIGNMLTIDLKLEVSSNQLDDVVVVGYGTQKKSELTNAVVQTSGTELKKTNGSGSLSNSLAGRLPGLYVTQTSAAPGADDAQILVRGPSTYRNTSALIVIDGVANADPDGLNRLDPNDIESISVLKDASAAIYGAQSAGGVILVTTKRGKSGKPVFDFSTAEGFQSPTIKPQAANVFDYMRTLNDRRALDGAAPDFPDAFVQQFTSGKRRGEDWSNALIGGPPILQTRQSLTMRGGSDNVRYFISLGTTSQGGILRGDDKTRLNQYNLRSNVDVTITKNFEVGADISIREKATNAPQTGLSGDIGFVANTSPTQEAYVDGNYNYPATGWAQLNPAARLLSPGYQRATTDVTTGTLRFKYKLPFLKGLSLDGWASVVKSVEYDKRFNYTWYYFEKNMAGDIVKVPSRTVEDPGLREDFKQSIRSTQNIRLSYDAVFNKIHKISAFVAYEQSVYGDNYFWTQRLGYDSQLIDQLFAGSPNRANWNNDGSGTQSSRQNYFGRVNYDLKGKYLLGLSARYDGSPIFPADKRFGLFPQVSAGWVISKEAFMSDSHNPFSNLKLRASWGQLGNDRVNPYQYISAYGYTGGWVVNGADARGLASKGTANPNITWEVSEKTDIGLEGGLFKDKISFEIDLFNSSTSHILGKRQASIPNYTGLVLPDENIGKMNSRGFEFQLGYNHSFGKLNMRLNGNVTYTENKVVYFDEAPQAEPYQKLEGMPFGSKLVYKAIGIYRTQKDLDNNVNYPGAKLGGLIFADLNHDGVIDARDQYMFNATSSTDPITNITSIFPSTMYALNIALNYKNFDMTIFFQGQSGAKLRLQNHFDSGAGGNGLAYVANNSYTISNPNAELPLVSPTGVGASDSDFYYFTSTWLRLKNVQLGYTIPKALLSKAKISTLKVYVSGANTLMVYNKLANFGAGDPEFLLGNGGGYPNMKTLTLGLNLTF